MHLTLKCVLGTINTFRTGCNAALSKPQLDLKGLRLLQC
jgi:hypothetical protein